MEDLGFKFSEPESEAEDGDAGDEAEECEGEEGESEDENVSDPEVGVKHGHAEVVEQAVKPESPAPEPAACKAPVPPMPQSMASPNTESAASVVAPPPALPSTQSPAPVAISTPSPAVVTPSPRPATLRTMTPEVA